MQWTITKLYKMEEILPYATTGMNWENVKSIIEGNILHDSTYDVSENRYEVPKIVNLIEIAELWLAKCCGEE